MTVDFLAILIKLALRLDFLGICDQCDRERKLSTKFCSRPDTELCSGELLVGSSTIAPLPFFNTL